MEKPVAKPFSNASEKTYGLMDLVKGTSPMVDKGPENTVMSWPNLLILEMLAALGTLVLLILWSLAVGAPLREMANPDLTENPAKAPWYFLNLQELLLHMHPALAGVIIPGAVVIALMAIPYIDSSRKDMGLWFASKKGKKIALVSALYTSLWIPALILFDEYIRVRSIISKPEIYPGWLIPSGIIAGLAILLYLLIRRWHPSKRETLIGLFTGFAVSYILMTVSGTLFRGLGMHLTLPWNLPPGALSF